MTKTSLPAGLRARLEQLFPGAEVEQVSALGDDETAGIKMKALGYGRPLRVELAGGRSVVFHAARPDDFGHDRRSDRLANLVLAYDTFGAVQHHSRAIDAGLVGDDGTLHSVAGTGEPYLLTEWVPGWLYAQELRQLADSERATPDDLARAEALARILLELHALPGSHAGAYTRAIRDLLGHGEGIFGLVDSYDPDTPGVPPSRLRAIEEACLAWRWKLRGRIERLRRVHGDFHPFNIVCDGAAIHLLDTSRGSEGDPADDVACLAINFLFFGMTGPARASWREGLGAVWDRFWSVYLAGDRVGVLDAVAPFFAWRALVLASPRWYPNLASGDRARILDFADRALAAERFDPAWGAEAMR
jgi:hypothetical protein